MKTKAKFISLSLITFLLVFPLFIFIVSIPANAMEGSIQTSGLGSIGTSSTSEDFNPTDTIFLSPNALIKDFSFDAIDNLSISGNQAFGGRLQMQRGANWIIDKDDVEVIHSYKSGNRTVSYLSVPAKMNITFFTNINLDKASRKMVKKQDEYQVGYLKHLNQIGFTRYKEEQNIYYSYYDFGDIQEYNSLYNDFSGSIDMTFNLVDTGLPQTVDFSNTTHEKSFQYVGVSSAQVNSYYTYNLTPSAPNLYGQAPNSPESDERASWETDDQPIAEDGYTLHWDHNISVDPITPASVSFDGGIIPQAEGSSLSPTLANGSDTWSGEYRSMPDCKLSYSLSSISPIVKEYYSELQYTSYRTILKDGVVDFLKIGPKLVGETIDTKTVRKPMALHVINRGIMTELQVNIGILTAYETEIVEDPNENIIFQDPEEIVEERSWTTIVDGMQKTTLAGQGTDLMPLVESLLFLDAMAQVMGTPDNPIAKALGIGEENAELGGDDWDNLSPMGKLKRFGWYLLIGGIILLGIIIAYYLIRFIIRQRRESKYHKTMYSTKGKQS